MADLHAARGQMPGEPADTARGTHGNPARKGDPTEAARPGEAGDTGESGGTGAAGERGPRRREEIFAAVLDLLADGGYDALTVERVAEHARVNKTTIYRWWGCRENLLRDCLLHSGVLSLSAPDTGSLRGDLIALAAVLRDRLREERTRALVEAALVGAARDQPLRELLVALLDERLVRRLPVLERAAARGELPPGFDPRPLADALAGALWVQLLLRRRPPTEEFGRSLLDLVLDGCGTGR
ncbi:TetR/AcrR family transcriptional regulator [Streptomyces zingiberis]|uniref:TetR/AcrR family transcriptional regulator n=1 Tax=Streptomyces zingiberis TaxID=2053010 RepID=A0ABX1BS92_9ACTN|nr:TetR/AcrR family transcriptional regulator [Streptomyces zingiberis]NJP99322.1 TetR/AcrR family transcriptional regulator [Streptomyces zingiberis]